MGYFLACYPILNWRNSKSMPVDSPAHSVRMANTVQRRTSHTMPPRTVSALIVLFWLATIGWFTYRDLWPYWAPEEAPPFVIDLADEATPNNEVLWQVHRQARRGGEPEEIGLARTRLSYFNDDDTFQVTSELVDVQLLQFVRVVEFTNHYRVTRAGELRSLSTEGKIEIFKLAGEAQFSGTVQNGRLVQVGKIKLPLVGTIEPKLEDVPAPRGSVLNPLHPVSRIRGLTPGRRWQMSVVNPLADAVEPALNAAWKKVQETDKPLGLRIPEPPRTLAAEVLRDKHAMRYDGVDHECFVIEYRGKDDEPPARTYVRVSDGLVLRQEASTLSERYYLQRMSARDAVRLGGKKRPFKKP